MDESNTHPETDSNQFSIGSEQPLEEIETDEGSHLDDVLAALADQRRRYALHYLREEQCASLAEIAEQIAAWEQDRSVDEVSDDTRAEIEIALFHQHLPQLREAGMIDYDEGSKIMAFQEPSEIADLCLDQCIQWEFST